MARVNILYWMTGVIHSTATILLQIIPEYMEQSTTSQDWVDKENPEMISHIWITDKYKNKHIQN